MSGTVRGVVPVVRLAADGTVDASQQLYRHYGHKEVLAFEELPSRKCCPECQLTLRRRDNETQNEFGLRTYCGRRCAREAVKRIPIIRKKVNNGPYWVD